MQQMADDVMDSSSGCGKQLSEAWHYMFGRESNYSAAYAAFVKTVELCFCKLASTVWALFFQQHRRLVSSGNCTVGTRHPFFLGYLVMRVCPLR